MYCCYQITDNYPPFCSLTGCLLGADGWTCHGGNTDAAGLHIR